MKKTLIFLAVTILLLAPSAFSDIGDYVSFKMLGDNPDSADFIIPADPWEAPSILSTHSGEGNACAGTGCWSRYIEEGTFVFDAVKDNESIGTITLSGFWFATTENTDSAVFNTDKDHHTTQMWGDFNIDLNYSGEIITGDFIGIMEYWDPVASPGYQVLDLLDINNLTGNDALRFVVDMRSSLPGMKIIITNKSYISVNSMQQNTQHSIEISKDGQQWGTMEFNNHIETFDELEGTSGFSNQTTYITRLRMDNITYYWTVEGWAKTFYVESTGKYKTMMTAGMVVEEGFTGVVDADEDGYYSDEDCNDTNPDAWLLESLYADNDADSYTSGSSVDVCTNGTIPEGYSKIQTDEDCNDYNESKWQFLTGYADNDFDTYTSGGAEQVCTGESLPQGYLETQNPEDCNDNDPSINPGQEEVCGNDVDEDCSGGYDNNCGIISGIVYSTNTWGTLSNIPVSIMDMSTEQTYHDSSDETGYYEILAPVGTYGVYASHECYTYPSMLYPYLELGPLSITDGGNNGENYVYMDLTCEMT